jgi:hypothetical protein
MREREDQEEMFDGRHFNRKIIIPCMRRYLRYKLSLCDLVEMTAEWDCRWRTVRSSRYISQTFSIMRRIVRGTDLLGEHALNACIRSRPVENADFFGSVARIS